jgi:hypothetical protein
MTTQDDLNEGQWVAAVAILLVQLVPLVTLLAAWLKHRFARAVVALQASTAGDDAPAPPSALPEPRLHGPAGPALQIVVDRAGAGAAGDHAGLPGLRLRRRVLAVQFTMGLLYWGWLLLAVLVALAMVGGQADGGGTGEAAVTLRGRLSAHLMLWPLLLAPPALAWAVQAGVAERRVWSAFGVTFALIAAGLALSDGVSPAAALAVAAGMALVGAMLVAFLRPAVRGAGPPLISAMIIGWLVMCVLLAIVAAVLGDDGDDDAPMTTRDGLLALGALAFVLLPSLWAGWRMLLRIARRYGEKRFSEVQLALGAYWGLITAFALALASMIAFDDKLTNAAVIAEWLAIILLVAWWLWRLVQRSLLRLITRKAPAPLGPLLFLRVFKPSSRSEVFTDRLLARWRFVAPVWMIAGPDLAGAYMEPDEFFAYLGRRLHERYITAPDQIAPRLAALDPARDPDGRFRVNDLYCANTTWKPVVLQLMGGASMVLLDLREYAAHRAGTRFELGELLRRAPLAKVLLLAGADQDVEQLREQVLDVWSEVAADRAADAARAGGLALRIMQIDDSDAALDGLIAALAGASRASRR